eukprot:1001326-Prymnesium_polylepis.2
MNSSPSGGPSPLERVMILSAVAGTRRSSIASAIRLTHPCMRSERSSSGCGVTRHTAFEPPSGMSLFLSCCAQLRPKHSI